MAQINIKVNAKMIMEAANGLVAITSAAKKLRRSIKPLNKALDKQKDVFIALSKVAKQRGDDFVRLSKSSDTIEKRLTALNTSFRNLNQQLSKSHTANNQVANSMMRTSTAAQSAARQMSLLQQISSRLKSLFLTLSSIAVFAYLRRALRGAIGLMARFEQSMANVQAVTNSTGAEFRALSGVARELGATTVFTAEQAAEGLVFLGRAGLSATESIESLPEALKLAQASGVDFAKGADLMVRALKGFGIQTSESAKVANIFASTAAASNVTVESLGEAFTHVAPLARTFGLSMTETSAAIAVLGNEGIRGGRAGRQLRTALVGLAKVSPKAEAVLNKYGLTVADVNVKTHGLSTVLERITPIMQSGADTFTLFRQRAAPVAQILSRSRAEFEHLRDEVVGADGELDRMSRTMTDTVQGSFKGFRSALAESVLSFGGANENGTFLFGLAQSLKFLGSLVSNLNGAAETFNENNNVTAEMAESTKSWAIALEQVGRLLQGAAIVGTVTLLTQGFLALKAAIGGATLAVTLAKAQFALIVGIVGGLSFAIVKASDYLNEFTGNDFSVIQNAIFVTKAAFERLSLAIQKVYLVGKLAFGALGSVAFIFGSQVNFSKTLKQLGDLNEEINNFSSISEKVGEFGREVNLDTFSRQIKSNSEDFKVANKVIKSFELRLDSLDKKYVATGKATDFTRQTISFHREELEKYRKSLERGAELEKQSAITKERLAKATDNASIKRLTDQFREQRAELSKINLEATSYGRSIKGVVQTIEIQQQAVAKAFAPAIMATNELSEAQKRRIELSRSSDVFRRDIAGANDLVTAYNKVNRSFESFNKRFVETGSVTDVQLASYRKLKVSLNEQTNLIQRINELKKRERFLRTEVARSIREENGNFQKNRDALKAVRKEYTGLVNQLQKTSAESGLSESIKNLSSNVKDQIDAYRDLRNSASNALNTIFDGFKRAITQSKNFGDFVKNIGLAFLEATGNAVKLVVQQKILNALGFGGENRAASGSLAERLLNSSTGGAASAAGEAAFKEAGKALTKEVGKGAKKFAGTVVTASATSAATTTVAGKVAGTSMAVGGETAGVAMAAGGKAAGAANASGSAAGALAITKAFAPILIGLAAAAVLFGTFKSISDRERNRNTFVEDSIIKRYENIGKLLNLTGKNLETFIESSIKSQTGRTVSGSRLEESGIQGAETGFTNQDILDFRKDLLSRYTRENLNNIIEGFSRRDVVVGNILSSQIGVGNLQERYNQKYSSGNKVNFQIIDQRQSETPLQAEAVDIGTNANGTQQFKIFVRDAVGDAINRGQLDRPLKSRYGINRRGT